MSLQTAQQCNKFGLQSKNLVLVICGGIIGVTRHTSKVDEAHIICSNSLKFKQYYLEAKKLAIF